MPSQNPEKIYSRTGPTILVIFGATGDLVSKKIAPALFHLFKKGELPNTLRIIGFSRREWSDQDFRNHVKEILIRHKDIGGADNELDKFLKLFSYKKGVFDQSQAYSELATFLGQVDGEWKACSNKLFYLAVSPKFYETIFKNLAQSGLTIPCGPEEGWTRIIVEKPFGNNLRTARRLELLLGSLFKDEQIYRIDHYLAKEMLQNILSFRFSNNLFEKTWDHVFLESIDIKLLESIGVENRGAFYDGIGALRDVGQNHLLQMLALITMDRPGIFSAEAIRRKRAEILKMIAKPSLEEIKKYTRRAQYQGYRNTKGVSPNSVTETYFEMSARIESPRWRGVKISMESGKRMGMAKKEIVVTFKHPMPCLCGEGGEHYKNRVIFHLEPKEGITIQFWSKKPGLKLKMEERTFDFLLRKESRTNQYVEEYEKLLLDCIKGDQTLFVNTLEIEAMWQFIDPIINAWRKNAVLLEFYAPDNPKELKKKNKESAKPIEAPNLKKEIAIVGLGKMGSALARNLMEKNWKVYGLNRTAEVTKRMESEGLIGAYSAKELIEKLVLPRLIWIMVPAGEATDEVLFNRKNGLARFLKNGDVIIDGGNSYFKDTLRRARKLQKYGIKFIDVGVSGGPKGARHGACLMIGGDEKLFKKYENLFADLALARGFGYMGSSGAGHFVKMIHNGIEYGMMQALAEGFSILKKSKYKLNLTKVSEVYNSGSVIESRLVGWLNQAFQEFEENLQDVSGRVAHTGEGEWTVKTAKELNVPSPIIEGALRFRVQSNKRPSYTGKILSALRNMFGGHDIK